MPINANVTASINVTQSGSNAFSGGPFWNAAIALSQAIPNGFLAGQADLAYVDERTLASGAADSIDLVGSLVDALGSTVNMVKVVTLMIFNQPKDGSSNTTALTIGGGTNPFVGFLGGTTPTIGPLRPGSLLLLTASDLQGLGTVTAGTADILRVANAAGATAKYQIAILGRSA